VALELAEGGTRTCHGSLLSRRRRAGDGRGGRRMPRRPRSDHLHVAGLFALAARRDVELDLLALLEGAKARALDVRVVDEDVVAVGAGQEAVPLFGVEELDGADRHVSSAFLAFSVSVRYCGAALTARSPWSPRSAAPDPLWRPATPVSCPGAPSTA